MLFHNKSMLLYIAILCTWVLQEPNHNIAPRGEPTPPIPTRAVFTFGLGVRYMRKAGLTQSLQCPFSQSRPNLPNLYPARGTALGAKSGYGHQPLFTGRNILNSLRSQIINMPQVCGYFLKAKGPSITISQKGTHVTPIIHLSLNLEKEVERGASSPWLKPGVSTPLNIR